MNLPQAKVLLEKIITLYKTLSNDEKNISAIERDLMLSYVRQLYETFLDTTTPVSQPAPRPVVTPPPPPQPKYEAPKVVVPPPVVEPPKPVYEAPQQPVYEAPKTPVYEAPKPPVVEQPKVVVAPPSPKPEVYHQPEIVSQPVPVAPKQPTQSPNIEATPDIMALFEDNTGRELSEKLSNMPIADLTKAFGFNDRLLTQNELFNANKPVFDEILKDLNNMSSFDSAKGLLISLASKYSWTATEDRKKQARAFIKLVRRRFS